MKLSQLATAAVITLASIFSNPIETITQKKLTISSASAQATYQESRIEITENTPVNEINHFFFMIENLWSYNVYVSESDKKNLIEDLEKIEAITKYHDEYRWDSICQVYLIAEAYDKAVKACEKDLESGEIPNPWHSIHQAYIATKQYDKAMNSLTKSINNDDKNNQEQDPFIHKLIGDVYFSLGNYNKAIKNYKEPIDSLINAREEKQNDGSLIALIQSNLGLALLREGKESEAENLFLEAMKNDQIYWNYELDGLSMYGNELGGLWEGYVLGQIQGIFPQGLTELRIKQNNYTDALAFAEYGRTRTLSYYISRNTESSISIDEIKDIAKEQNATLIKYFTPTSIDFGYAAIPQEYEPKVYIWVVKPTGEVHFANVNLNPKESVSAANIPVIPILILVIGTGLTVYFLRNRKPYLIAGLTLTAIATATTLFIHQNNPVATNVNYNIDGSIADLSNNTFATVRGRNSQEVTENLKEGTCHKDDDCLQQLHKILIDPIAQHLPSNPEEEIVIIPDGELFKVPFAALKNNNNQYLIENHTLRVAPSIQLLKFTAQQQAKQTPKNFKTALIVGNPEMPRGNNNQPLDPLPGTEEEAYAIAELLDTTPLIGENATEWLIKNNIEYADIIHFATHGDPTSLVFASSSSNDGFLRDGEIYGLDLQAELVVLSACETGLGEITSDGIVGISRPFIAAGVPSVVMSLWLVPDAATSELMIDFHKNLQTGQNKAQALRQAMLSTMKTNPEPVNWAGFILVGESDPIQ
ncbi:CHAT domain-containing tetratricopeptide repeat protein [Crocosphaera sp.]|uniref:CHAT domain-containing protein n=1 Tax=Crocosphaera sp. TaxID=2729996 RepID=UPI0026201831|nr:CHAT domain-containing tetratricopeptide repeat protein [Crocosphaera sp.]MDJ0579478.1 CHAT domain-containing protein [Crocosphaera sp.]